MKHRSWIAPNDSMIQTHQIEQPSTTISALTDQGVVYSQLSFGSNADVDILYFLIEMFKLIKAGHKDDYKQYTSKLVVVMDNASVHRTDLISKFFDKACVVCVTLPQYTPEMNPIEKFFRSVKYRMSRANLFKK